MTPLHEGMLEIHWIVTRKLIIVVSALSDLYQVQLAHGAHPRSRDCLLWVSPPLGILCFIHLCMRVCTSSLSALVYFYSKLPPREQSSFQLALQCSEQRQIMLRNPGVP